MVAVTSRVEPTRMVDPGHVPRMVGASIGWSRCCNDGGNQVATYVQMYSVMTAAIIGDGQVATI